MNDVLIFATILAPIITAFIEVVKKSFPEKTLPARFIPLIALVIGLVVGFLATPFTDLGVELRLWAGALAGLASVGLFRVVKDTVKTPTK